MNNGKICSNEHSKYFFEFIKGNLTTTWQPSWICTNIFLVILTGFLLA